jgi:hypothetical protein
MLTPGMEYSFCLVPVENRNTDDKTERQYGRHAFRCTRWKTGGTLDSSAVSRQTCVPAQHLTASADYRPNRDNKSRV